MNNVLAFRTVPDGAGGFRHVIAPVPATPAKAKKKPSPPDPIKSNGSSAGEELRLFIERIERIDEEARGIADDKKDVLLEAKSRGYDTRTLKTIIALRRMEGNARLEAEALLETYKAALGIA
jgi:uncharacterized protein (UPF0335 family)